MTNAAIKIGAQMGIDLRGGTPVKASGNCLIESIKGNVDEREIFDVKLNETSIELRINSALEGEKVIGESPYRIEDYDEAQWAQGWNQLKNEGIWDVEYFGDLMIIALAHYIHKNILLINTDPDSPKVTVIFGDQFGAKLDRDFPVILAYSGDHYESLLPNTMEDEENTKLLISKYVKGEDLCLQKLDNETNDDNIINKRKMNVIETVKNIPHFQIDNWEHHKDENNVPSLSTNFQQLVLGTAENAFHPVIGKYAKTKDRSAEDSQINLGIDNWKHCHPDLGSNFSSASTSGWGDTKRSISIPIILEENSPERVKIPITRVTMTSSKYQRPIYTTWEDIQ